MASFGCYDNSDVIATRIITNFHLYLIQLWWQFFQMFVYGVVVYAQKNFTVIDPEKLYRATFICYYGLCCCIVWPSFLFDCFVKNWATCKNFLGKWFTLPPPPAKNCPYAHANSVLKQVYFEKVGSCCTLCFVCYSKNKNEDDALSLWLNLDRNSRGGYSLNTVLYWEASPRGLTP